MSVTATVLKSMKDMQKYLNINKNVQPLILLFSNKHGKTEQVIICKGQIVSSLSVPNRSNWITQ